ncbi:purine permease, partial [Halomonas sp. MG34]|nr:purine permease [Halomonas sp. MG34]
FGTLTFIVLMYRFSSGFLRSISILVGIVIGTVVASFMGKVSLDAVTEASFFHIVQPFYFGTPTFEWSAILTMILVAIVSLVESTGVYFALGDITERKLKEKDLTKGYRAEGLAILLGGLFNAFPYTAFSQNVGLIQMTGVKSIRVIMTAGIMLVGLGLVPKIAALTTIIPTAVLGGAMIAMFGMVIAQGIKMLGSVLTSSPENSMIIACSVGMGLGVTVVPELFAQLPNSLQILTSNGIVAGSVTAIVLNIIFNMLPSKKTSANSAQLVEESA